MDVERIAELRERELFDGVIVNECLDAIERLQAIVDKLPKTADDVPVVPGMILWRPIGSWWKARLIDEGGDSNRFQGFYSTRKAAEAEGGKNDV